MRSKLTQRIKEYLKYTKNRKNIAHPEEIYNRFGYMLPNGSFKAGKWFDVEKAKCIWNLQPKLVFDIMSKQHEDNYALRLLAIEDIDNPTDEEMALLIDEGKDLDMLDFCVFLYGKQKAYERILKVAKRIRVPPKYYVIIRQDMFDFLAAVPQKLADKIEYLHRLFNGPYTMWIKDHQEFDKLCQKNPIYYKKIDIFINQYVYFDAYREAMTFGGISDFYRQCLVATRCCKKRNMTSTDKKFLKNHAELSGLLRLYNYSYDNVIGCLLDNN